MKKIQLFSILVFCLLVIQIQAQTALLNVENQVIDGTTVTFDISIEASGDDIFLGNSDFVLSYNTGAFSSPVLSVTTAGDFRTESDNDLDALITQDNYFFNTATSISGGNLIINLSGPNPSNINAYERRTAKFPDGDAKRFASFEITGYQGGDLNLAWVDASTLVSTITLPGFTEVQVGTTNTLPVELASFEAYLDKRNLTVDLIWKTLSEKNNDGFEVQHSSDGHSWSKLTFVPGQGTTDFAQDYDYVHLGATAGNNYYRLKQMDFDGTFEYSDVRVVQLDSDFAKISIYPNPTVDVVNVELAELETARDILIYDQQGKLVYSQIIEPGAIKASLQLGHLSAGLYLMNIPTGNNSYQTENLIIKR